MRWKSFGVAPLAALLFCGCAVFPHFAVAYSHTSRTAKAPLARGGASLQERDYVILGRASGSATVENYLGLWADGSDAVSDACADALRRYPEADMLIHVRAAVETERVVLPPCFFLYVRRTVKVTGMAVKLKRP